ncbi:MAG: RNA polymerase factor sigma-70, partial [bacterium]|nr:RNA polymerase factor sigma-70 [bacterium]
ELSFEEIGKLQGVRKDTVRMRWTRLIEKIAQIVKSDE